jgi:hypothetical protein
LVAVWDGKPSAGRGGTPEIIEYALARTKPVAWVSAAADPAARVLIGTTEAARLAARQPALSWIDSLRA